MSLIEEEEKDLANTNLQVAEPPVIEEDRPEPVVERSEGTVPRVAESQGFVDTELVSQAPVVNDEEMPTEGFVSTDMPMVSAQTTTGETVSVNQDASDVDSTIPRKEPIVEEPTQFQPLSTNEIYSSEIEDTGARQVRTNEEILGPKLEAIRIAEQEERRRSISEGARQAQINAASILLLGEINPETGRYENGLVDNVNIIGDLNPVQVLLNPNAAITRADAYASNKLNIEGLYSDKFQKNKNGGRLVPAEVTQERLQDYYLKRDGNLDDYYEDLNNHMLDVQMAANRILVQQAPLLFGDVVEATLQFPIEMIDFIGVLGQGGSVAQLYREAFPDTEEGKEQYDRFQNALNQNLIIDDYEKTITTDNVEDNYYEDVIPSAGEIFADLIQSEQGNLGYFDRANTFGNRLQRAMNTDHPEHLDFKLPSLRDGTLGLTNYGISQGLKVIGNIGEFAKNLGPVGYNSFLQNHPTLTNIMEFGFALGGELKLIEAPIRKALVHNNRKLFLDTGGGMRLFLRQQEELTQLNGNNLKQQIKKNRTLNRKFSRVKTIEGYGGWLKSIDRDINLQFLSFGAGYTGLEILDVFEDRPLTGAAALLALGIFGPTALDSMYQGVKGKLGIGPTARIDFYLAGGGTLDDFIKSQKNNSPFLRDIEDLDGFLATKTDSEKLKLIQVNEVEIESIIRFGEQLKGLKESNLEVYNEMVVRMERVRELRNSVLKDFNPEDLVGVKFKDTDGNLYSYDLEQLTAMKDQFTIFLDEFINSGTLKAVRTGLQDNVANLNAFGRLNKKIVLGDIDRYLKIEEDRNEFLAMQLKRLLPIFQQSNEGASQTIKKFQDIITKEKTEIAEAQTYNESITNLQNSKERKLDAELQGESNWITDVEAEAATDEFIVGDKNLAIEIRRPKVVAGTSIDIETGETDPLVLYDGESPNRTLLEAGGLLSTDGRALSPGEIDDISEGIFIGVYKGDKAVIDKKYSEYKGANHSIAVSNKPADIYTEQPDIDVARKEKRVRESVVPDSTDYTAGRKTDDQGNLIITFGDDSTEIIPPLSKIPTENNLPSDIRVNERVYTFGRGVDADRQVFPSTEGYDSLESFIRSTDASLSEFDTKQRLRIWRITEDNLEPLREGYMGEVPNFDPNDPFNIEFNIAKLDEELKGISGLSENEIDRYVRIYAGGQATKPVDDEFFKLRADNVDEVDVFDFEQLGMREQEILQKLAKIEQDEANLLEGTYKTDLMDVVGIGGYYQKIRSDYINSFEDIEQLGDYVKLRIDEIEAASGTKFNPQKRANLYNYIERYKRGELRGDEKVLNRIKNDSIELLKDQPAANVIINANDIHQIRSHFGSLAYQNYGTPKGQKYRARSAALNEFIEIAFPELKALNLEYKNFAEQYKQGPFSLIKDKDAAGERVVPGVKFTETFLEYKDPVKAVEQFKRTIGQTTGPDGKIIMLDPKTVGPMREQAFGLLFYTIAERMRKNARAQGGGARGNLLNESDRIFLLQAKKEGIFSGNLTNPDAKYDYTNLVDKLLNWDNYNKTYRASIEQNATQARIEFDKKLQIYAINSRLTQAAEFANMGKSDDDLYNWFTKTTEQDLEKTIDELVVAYESQGMDLAKFYRERPNFRPAVLNLKPDFLLTDGKLDIRKLVKYDMQEAINRAVNSKMLRVNSSTKITQLVNKEINKVPTYGSPVREGFMPRSSDESLKESKGAILKLGDEIMVAELGDFLKDHSTKLDIIYGKDHTNKLIELHELSTVIAKGKDDVSFLGKPTGPTVPGIMSRVFAWYRGVIGTKYILGEMALTRFRMSQANAIQRLIANPDAVDLLLETFKSDAPISSKDATRAVSVLKGIFLIPDVESDADAEQAWIEEVNKYKEQRGIVTKPPVEEQIKNLK